MSSGWLNALYPRHGVSIVLVLAGISAIAVMRPSKGAEEAYSFDMWCMEIAMQPVPRCIERLPADIKDYENYRITFEHYQQQKSEQVRKDKEISDKLNNVTPAENQRRSDVPPK